MNWNREQTEAIELRGKDLLVSAAAGSGKTAVLVERIKEIIRRGEAAPEELLVLTFTEAAASEMRAKIIDALPEQAARIHKAQISTFHAFAMEIIRNFFPLIDADPSFRVCDEEMGKLLGDEAMDELFETHFEEEDPDLHALLRKYCGSRDKKKLRDMIEACYRFTRSVQEPEERLEAH